MGAVVPAAAPALSAGPVPYPVMLGSDPGVHILMHLFYRVSLNHDILPYRPIPFSCLKQWNGVSIARLMVNLTTSTSKHHLASGRSLKL